MSRETELSPEELTELRAFVEGVGMNEAARRLEVSRETVTRALALVPIRRGSVALLRSQLAHTPDA